MYIALFAGLFCDMLGVLFYHEKKHFTLDWRILTLLYKADNKYYCWPRTFSFELEFPLRHFYCRYESARLHSSLFLMEIQVKLKKTYSKVRNANFLPYIALYSSS